MLDFYNIAKAELGVVEKLGDMEHNPRILEYLATCKNEPGTPKDLGELGIWAASRDETAWCSAFVNWVILQAGIPKEHAPNDARAIAWLDWGIEIEEPQRGCISIIRRRQSGPDSRTGSSTGNHVALFDKPGNGVIWLLGGNQRNSVRFSQYRLARYDVLGYRAPDPAYWQPPIAA
jgi:uncharacterized protein (TIGR02594 family)